MNTAPGGTDATDQDWPSHLDAMQAAPDHHLVLLENDRVRVLDSRIAPGDTVPLHTHRWPAVTYVLSLSDFVRYDGEGNVLLDTRNSDIALEEGIAAWTPPLPPHRLENVGEREIRVVTVEFKDQ
jgi:quercetin dioxygenase-like cupin family protein